MMEKVNDFSRLGLGAVTQFAKTASWLEIVFTVVVGVSACVRSLTSHILTGESRRSRYILVA